MRRFLIAGGGLAALAACDVPPQGTTPDDLAAFDQAVASIGCDLVGDSDYLPVELQTGLSREQVVDIAAYRVATEAAVRLENGGVRLVTGACKPEQG